MEAFVKLIQKAKNLKFHQIFAFLWPSKDAILLFHDRVLEDW